VIEAALFGIIWKNYLPQENIRNTLDVLYQLLAIMLNNHMGI